jgi:hypothetical protein
MRVPVTPARTRAAHGVGISVIHGAYSISAAGEGSSCSGYLGCSRPSRGRSRVAGSAMDWRSPLRHLTHRPAKPLRPDDKDPAIL